MDRTPHLFISSDLKGRKHRILDLRLALAFIARAVIFTGGLATLLFLSACTRLPTYRFEILVEVDTPEGVRTGSGKMEVVTYTEPRLLPDMLGYNETIHGEAIVVELPRNQRLYAALRTERGGLINDVAIDTLISAQDRRALSIGERAARLARPGQVGAVPRNAYPLFVRFEREGDPRSMQRVDPDNLAAAFGAGIRLRRIIVRTTADGPTYTLQRSAPWLMQEFRVSPRDKNGRSIVMRREAFQWR